MTVAMLSSVSLLKNEWSEPSKLIRAKNKISSSEIERVDIKALLKSTSPFPYVRHCPTRSSSVLSEEQFADFGHSRT